jgi:selenocysteine lyase/cysteine desulfurase
MSIPQRAFSDDLNTNKALIHFNNAGASIMPKAVLNSQTQHLLLESQIGGYEAAKQMQTQISDVYASVAKLINCHPDEVALVENATIGWVAAFQSIPFKKGDKILTVECEYGSNYLAYLQLQAQKGVEIEVIPSTGTGEACVATLQDILEKDIDKKIKLISVTHIPTNGGLVNPIIEIGKLARQYNVLYLVDACQTAGQLPIDVIEIGCDFLSATGRKYLRGPRGSGFLYVRKEIIEQLEPPMVDVRSARWTDLNTYTLKADATRFENWENNYAALLGLGCAIDYALDIGIENIVDKNNQLATSLRDKLSAISTVTVQDIGSEQCAIVTFSVQGVESLVIKEALQAYSINVSCSSPSSTLIDATRRNLPDLVRSSVHYFNTDQQISIFIDALNDIIKYHHERQS